MRVITNIQQLIQLRDFYLLFSIPQSIRLFIYMCNVQSTVPNVGNVILTTRQKIFFISFSLALGLVVDSSMFDCMSKIGNEKKEMKVFFSGRKGAFYFDNLYVEANMHKARFSIYVHTPVYNILRQTNCRTCIFDCYRAALICVYARI